MQQLDISLDSIGYIYSRQLNDYNSNYQQKLPFHFESVVWYQNDYYTYIHTFDNTSRIVPLLWYFSSRSKNRQQ